MLFLASVFHGPLLECFKHGSHLLPLMGDALCEVVCFLLLLPAGFPELNSLLCLQWRQKNTELQLS